MDVDAMHQRNTNRREPLNGASSSNNDWKKTVTCYNCDKKGHIARECRLKRREQPQQSKGQSQSNKKFTPTQLRHHIAALVSENMKGQDYDQFLQEVNNYGFDYETELVKEAEEKGF